MNKTNEKDFTMSGFYVSCVVEAFAYFVIDEKFGVSATFIYLSAGLIAYFLFLAYKKSEIEASWTSSEIFAGFLGCLIALVLPLFLGIITGTLLN